MLLTVFHAGSVKRIVALLAADFEASHPGVSVRLVGGGSVDLARRLYAGEPADVFISADCAVLRELSPKIVAGHSPFAGNRMVLAYRPDSRGAGTVSADNWHRILRQPEVCFAHSDPDGDPGGYRTLLVWKLAESHYGQPGLCESLVRAPGRRVYSGPTMAAIHEDFRTGRFDYAFFYASTARQRGLAHVALPPQVDLSDPGRSDLYARARLTVKGVSGEAVRVGEPVVFGAAVVSASADPALGSAFVALLLNPNTSALLAEAGFAPLSKGN